MLGYIQGKILGGVEYGRVIVGVGTGESGVLGYSVSIPAGSQYAALSDGQEAAFYLYSHIREEAFDLYGFQTREEKEVFMTLLSVSGVGPKAALAALSHASHLEIVRAVMEKDKQFFTKIPGVGKKTAERIILDTHDGVKKKVESGQLTLRLGSQERATSSVHQGLGSSVRGTGAVSSEVFEEASLALKGLGYREPEIEKVIQKVSSQDASRKWKTEELIRGALQGLS